MPFLRSTFVAALFLFLCGCGEPTADISGTVLFNAKPLKGGNITFVPLAAGKGTVTARIAEDGTYKALKVPFGEAKICVETETVNTAKLGKMPKNNAPGGQASPNTNPGSDVGPGRYVKIPDRYSKTDTTDLTITVNSGSMEHNVELR